MNAIGYLFGLVAFCMVCALSARVKRLEQLLRENGIGSLGAKALGGQLRKHVGQTLTLTLYQEDMELSGLTARVLDVDETWALLLADEGKKKERELLIRLDSVKQIKVK